MFFFSNITKSSNYPNPPSAVGRNGSEAEVEHVVMDKGQGEAEDAIGRARREADKARERAERARLDAKEAQERAEKTRIDAEEELKKARKAEEDARRGSLRNTTCR